MNSEVGQFMQNDQLVEMSSGYKKRKRKCRIHFIDNNIIQVSRKTETARQSWNCFCRIDNTYLKGLSSLKAACYKHLQVFNLEGNPLPPSELFL